jgi:hypothetical protein
MASARFILGPGLLLAVASAGLAAADAPKQPVSETINAARQGLEALKADPTLPSTDLRLTLPSFDTPSLTLPAPTAPLLPVTSAQPDQPTAFQAGKSSSWLIDAMEKNSSASVADPRRGKTSRTNDDTKAGLSLTPGTERNAADDKDNALAENVSGDRTALSDQSPVKDAPNPLGGFMAGWMTARDFNLLYKTTEGGAAPFGSLSTPADNTGLNLLPTGTDFAAAMPGGSAVVAMPRSNPGLERPENPYLQTLAPALMPGGSGPADLSTPPMPVPPLSALAPLQSDASARSQPPSGPGADLPEILKRDDNAKYFPQLKHF